MAFIFVSGAVRSGKSEWAERRAMLLADDGPLVYLATARVCDQEMAYRILRHQNARKGRGFTTIERETNLSSAASSLPPSSTALLECLATWTANEMFSSGGKCLDVETTVEKICADVEALKARTKHLLIVSNDIFSDGTDYSPETESYRRALGRLHVLAAKSADVAVECVYGYPIYHKGRLQRLA